MERHHCAHCGTALAHINAWCPVCVPYIPTDQEIEAASARAEQAIGMTFDSPEYEAIGIAHRCLARLFRRIDEGTYSLCVADVAKAICDARKFAYNPR